MVFTKMRSAQTQLGRRVTAATHIRPIFMPRDEFESLLCRKILDTAEGEILSDADDFVGIQGLGRMGALELLFKVGLVLSELNIPNIEQDNE